MQIRDYISSPVTTTTLPESNFEKMQKKYTNVM